MAIGNTPYSSDRYAMSHEMNCGRLKASASNEADEVVFRHRFFTAVKVLEVKGTVHAVGSSDDTAFVIYKGTSSIGSVAVGTSTAGTVVSASLTDTDFAATDDLSIKQAVATETGAANIYLEYQEMF